MKARHLTCFILLAGLSALAQSAEVTRWYSDAQVAQGDKLFAANCATCHGKQAEATPDWRKREADGGFVPPPLNGTAHAWHHSMKILRNTIRKGGAPVGGKMPAFGDKLSDAQIDAIIASFQSKWSDKIYQGWLQRGGDAGFQPATKKTQSQNPITQRLRLRLGDEGIGEPVTTPVNGLYQTKIGAEYIYLLNDGRYALTGELIDLETGENLTNQSKKKDTLSLIKDFPEADMVVYPATGKTKQTITILTDTDCPFCRKLHKEVSNLQAAGIKVRYIPFPRDGKTGPGYAGLQSVWCAKDRNRAMDIAKGVTSGELPKGDCKAAAIVDRGFALGIKIGIRGTPAIVLEDGTLLEGYVPSDKLIQFSQANQKN